MYKEVVLGGDVWDLLDKVFFSLVLLEQVRVDHMTLALSRTFKSTIVDTIQSLPQHQQIVLCSMVKLFRGTKKDTIVGELNRSYIDLSKSAQIPPASFLKFSNMCRVHNDQGIFKMGQSRDDRSKRVTLKVDESDTMFALQAITFDNSFGLTKRDELLIIH
ncbi:hypothetical protein IFM89_007267 [Coptis chinensis]|uniref:Cdc6 C-terminal domain-containing protein n=1 Tax=Coptis chinensis TaxID=261450 RepID=A0A835ILQ3_9MAGN|nr:hypothetical protein IFM89_007267 [Coptis chinensis]